jgi:hypothetical protein
VLECLFLHTYTTATAVSPSIVIAGEKNHTDISTASSESSRIWSPVIVSLSLFGLYLPLVSRPSSPSLSRGQARKNAFPVSGTNPCQYCHCREQTRHSSRPAAWHSWLSAGLVVSAGPEVYRKPVNRTDPWFQSTRPATHRRNCPITLLLHATYLHVRQPNCPGRVAETNALLVAYATTTAALIRPFPFPLPSTSIQHRSFRTSMSLNKRHPRPRTRAD